MTRRKADVPAPEQKILATEVMPAMECRIPNDVVNEIKVAGLGSSHWTVLGRDTNAENMVLVFYTKEPGYWG